MTTHMQQALAEDERHRSVSATILWLRHSGNVDREARRRMATTIMAGAVAAQAVLLGIVRCGYCMDSGCRLCARPVARTRRPHL